MQLTLEQNAIGHAVAVMLEFNTAVAGFTWRYGYNMEEFCEKVKKLSINTKHRLNIFTLELPFISIKHLYNILKHLYPF